MIELVLIATVIITAVAFISAVVIPVFLLVMTKWMTWLDERFGL